MHNKIAKIVYIVIGVYMLLYVTLPIRRTLYDWQVEENPLFSYLVNPGQNIVMFLIALFAIVNLVRSIPLLNKLTQPKILTATTFVILPTCLILFVLRIPGLWWTWSTVGLHFSSVVLIALLLKDKVPSSIALFFACGCAFVTIGVWEIVYKYGFWYFNDLPQNISINAFWGQFWFMMPFVLYGLVVLVPHLFKYKRLVQINIPAAVCFTLLVGAFTYWYVSGFWCDISYDWSTKSWYLNPKSDWLSMMVYRSSKVWFNLFFASLVWIAPAVTVFNRKLCLQFGHCKKEKNNVS